MPQRSITALSWVSTTFGGAGFELGQGFTDAQNRDQAALLDGFVLGSHHVVGLCVQGTTLAVTDQGVGATEGFEHGGRFAGEGAGLVERRRSGHRRRSCCRRSAVQPDPKDNRRADGHLHRTDERQRPGSVL